MSIHTSKFHVLKTMQRIQRKRWARVWYVRGLMVGSFKTRAGKVLAVGHNELGECIIYDPTKVVPSHGWSE